MSTENAKKEGKGSPSTLVESTKEEGELSDDEETLANPVSAGPAEPYGNSATRNSGPNLRSRVSRRQRNSNQRNSNVQNRPQSAGYKREEKPRTRQSVVYRPQYQGDVNRPSPKPNDWQRNQRRTNESNLDSSASVIDLTVDTPDDKTSNKSNTNRRKRKKRTPRSARTRAKKPLATVQSRLLALAGESLQKNTINKPNSPPRNRSGVNKKSPSNVSQSSTHEDKLVKRQMPEHVSSYPNRNTFYSQGKAEAASSKVSSIPTPPRQTVPEPPSTLIPKPPPVLIPEPPPVLLKPSSAAATPTQSKSTFSAPSSFFGGSIFSPGFTFPTAFLPPPPPPPPIPSSPPPESPPPPPPTTLPSDLPKEPHFFKRRRPQTDDRGILLSIIVLVTLFYVNKGSGNNLLYICTLTC